eukprot:CAMPEP_0197623074 /NCGR_PEP_ID=MMETSP1338-20131121/3141_1 /TAXON_ID=43686 ORGANISM="Pelagodinium beii, Strain RCC1491" /NCGR_SAMPLE_ID=MMETSP1338 /ASSEMBLY_ACC=CAM_ASM_000754 /LENGTH=414 /DNA_ID=CAMNT_0043192911 /DNA_START=37 /DNA_END=1281 /DNA_ORIENTATION=-
MINQGRAVRAHAKSVFRSFSTEAHLQRPSFREVAKACSGAVCAWGFVSGIAAGDTGVFEMSPTGDGVQRKYMMTLTSGNWQGDSMVGLAAGNILAFWKLGRSASWYVLAPSCALALFRRMRESSPISLQLFQFSIIRNSNAEDYRLSEAESDAIKMQSQRMLSLNACKDKTTCPMVLLEDDEFLAGIKNCKRIFERFCKTSLLDEQVIEWRGTLDANLAMADRAVIKAAFSVMDPEGMGELTFTEFASGALAACCGFSDCNNKQAQDMLHELTFRILDHDNNGVIEKRELSCWVGTLLKNGMWKCKIDGDEASFQDLKAKGDWQGVLDRTTVNLLKQVKTSKDDVISLSEYLEMKAKTPWQLPIAVWLKSRVVATPGQSFRLTCFSAGGRGWEWDFCRSKWIRSWYRVTKTHSA